MVTLSIIILINESFNLISTVSAFLSSGARVIVACRNIEKADQAVSDIKESCKGLNNLGTIETVKLDLSSLKSVRDCATQLLNNEARIDLLINNAGVMMCPESRTEEGFEMQFGTNHLGHFLFTMLLLPKLCQSVPARIVNVSSAAHSMEKGITGVTTYSLHPGVIKTDLARHVKETVKLMHYFNVLTSFTHKTAPQGAQTTIHCAVSEECAGQSGLYYAECAVKTPSNAARNEEDAKKLWDISWKLVGLDECYDPFVQS